MADVEYVDDPQITNDAELWRRLPPLPPNCAWVVRDENAGGLRVSSAAFNDSPDKSPMSVQLAGMLLDASATREEALVNALARYPGFGMATITAGTVRSLGQGVMHTPRADDPAHASVFGPKTGAKKKAMARAARLLKAPNT